MSRNAAGRVDPFRGKWRARLRGKHIGLFESEDEGYAAIAAVLARDAGKKPDTCRTYADAWFEARELSGVVALIEPQKSDWRSRVDIKDEKGHKWLDMPPSQVRTVHLQRWLKALSQQRCKSPLISGSGDAREVVLRPTARKLSHESIKKAVSLVSLYFDWLKSEGKREGDNPAHGLMMPVKKPIKRAGKQRIPHLLAEEIEQLFELEMPAWRRAMFALAIYAGLRRAELWGLRWEEVDWEQRQLLVRSSYDGDVKSQTSIRDVPLLPFAWKQLRAYWSSLPARPISGLVFQADDTGVRCHNRDYDAGWRDKKERRGPGGKLRVVPGWRSRAGLRPELTFLALRHTCGCHLIQGTVLGNRHRLTLEEVSKWLGHSSLQVTERHYADLAPGNLMDKAHGRAGRLKVVQQSGTED